MKIAGCKYAPFKLKFKRPFTVSNTELSEKSIIIIKIQDDDGFFSYGEAAPLPEFGSETFERAEEFLKAALRNLPGKEFTDIYSIRQYLDLINPPPAARFALEEALLLLIVKNSMPLLSRLLELNARPLVKINAALSFLAVDDYIPKIKELINAGFSAIKIKIGRDDFKDDLYILQNIRDYFGASISLRADVNGKWKFEEAVENIKQLDGLDLEYIEQPVNTLEEFIELKNKVKSPIAADESIRSLSGARKFIEAKAVDCLVIKPMLAEGVFPVLEIINIANEKNIKTVFSSSFETALGALPSIMLASGLKDDISHGFGVFSCFENDPLNSSTLLKNGAINLIDIDLENIYSAIEENINFKNA